MSHIQKAKEIMAKINQKRNANRTDPSFRWKKQAVLETKDPALEKRVQTKELTEADKAKIMKELRNVHQQQHKTKKPKKGKKEKPIEVE